MYCEYRSTNFLSCTILLPSISLSFASLAPTFLIQLKRWIEANTKTILCNWVIFQTNFDKFKHICLLLCTTHLKYSTFGSLLSTIDVTVDGKRRQKHIRTVYVTGWVKFEAVAEEEKNVNRIEKSVCICRCINFVEYPIYRHTSEYFNGKIAMNFHHEQTSIKFYIMEWDMRGRSYFSLDWFCNNKKNVNEKNTAYEKLRKQTVFIECKPNISRFVCEADDQDDARWNECIWISTGKFFCSKMSILVVKFFLQCIQFDNRLKWWFR